MTKLRNRSKSATGGLGRRPRSGGWLVSVVLLGAALTTVPTQAALADVESASGSGSTLDVSADNNTAGTHDLYRLSRTHLRAGLVRVRLHDVGTVPHQVQLFRLHSGVTAASYRRALLASKGGAALKLADAAGGSGTIDPGGLQTTYVNLRAGRYVAMCFLTAGGNGEPHFVHGMFAPFTVSGTDERDTPAGHVLGTIRAFTTSKSLGFAMPSVIEGDGLYRFTNTARRDTHELALLKLAPGRTANDFRAWATHGMTGRPPVMGNFGGGQALPPHGELWVRMHMPAGNYVATCFVPDDTAPHLPHAAMGMIQAFRVVA